MTAAVLGRANAGPALVPVDIGHAICAAVTDPSTAFWALVDKKRITESSAGGPLLDAYREKADSFARELHALRFELKPSGVYLNPTERCNLNCTYCYLPGEQRNGGSHMPAKKLIASLDKLCDYFHSVMPEGRKPRAIFNGGNLLAAGGVEAALASTAFETVTTRDVDEFSPCGDCSIRHFCGSPCPAEAHEMNGGTGKTGAFCEFYKEQVNYALRLIADGNADNYLWDGWDESTETVFNLAI